MTADGSYGIIMTLVAAKSSGDTFTLNVTTYLGVYMAIYFIRLIDHRHIHPLYHIVRCKVSQHLLPCTLIFMLR